MATKQEKTDPGKVEKGTKESAGELRVFDDRKARTSPAFVLLGGCTFHLPWSFPALEIEVGGRRRS
jgi:hypothetical protein